MLASHERPFHIGNLPTRGCAPSACVGEYLEDETIRTNLEQRGFVEQTRFTLPGEREMVVLVRTPIVST